MDQGRDVIVPTTISPARIPIHSIQSSAVSAASFKSAVAIGAAKFTQFRILEVLDPIPNP
jgi:hypothetical protein